MQTCFVIQPFDKGKFDKRFVDVYKPAIEAAGFEAYRVDQDDGVLVPIESIERGIRQAAVCLADITADNPNVWYELGFAYAAKRPVVMVCSEERTGKKYPFDIQHRAIIPYLADAPSDFNLLRDAITNKITAVANREAQLEQYAESTLVAPIRGLSQPEVLVLAVVASAVSMPDGAISVGFARKDAEIAGITTMGFNVAVRRLERRGFALFSERFDEDSHESYSVVQLTDDAWTWIDDNETQFRFHIAPTTGAGNG
jgi:hypothetical protein